MKLKSSPLFQIVTLGLLTVTLGAWSFMQSSKVFPPTLAMDTFYNLSAKTLDGDDFSFETLKGKRVLIVNTASKCGYTKQYAALEDLHKKHGGDNFAVIGFPCNDFGRQEPGSAEEIASFCSKNFGVTFQMMEKVHVGGNEQHPVYSWLCDADKNGVANNRVGWNFHKFLVNAEGQLVSSLRSGVKPSDPQIIDFAVGK